jgi:hypothetical protein
MRNAKPIARTRTPEISATSGATLANSSGRAIAPAPRADARDRARERGIGVEHGTEEQRVLPVRELRLQMQKERADAEREGEHESRCEIAFPRAIAEGADGRSRTDGKRKQSDEWAHAN